MRRRCAASKPKRRHALCRLAAALLLVWALFAFYWYVEERFEPVLDELAEYEAGAAVTRAVQSAVSAELAAHPQRYARLYRVQYRDDGAAIVQADTAAMNAARLALVAAVDAALLDLPELCLTVPFGTLTDLSLLNGLGPGWPLSIRPEAFAAGELRETAETVAINATRYRAVLDLTVSVNMVIDGKNRVLRLQSAVPVASVVVGGDTPLLYAAGS